MIKVLAPTLRDLLPDLTGERLARAEDNLEQYLGLVIRIYERIQSDPAAYAEFRRLTCKTPAR